MMKLSLPLMVVVFLSLFIGSVMGEFSIYRNYSIPTRSNGSDYPNSLRIHFGISSLTLFEVVHCFGEFDWYVGVGFPPNASTSANGTFHFLWDPDSVGQTFGLDIDATLHFLFVCKNSYPGVCATFDFILANQSTNISRDVQPEIPNRVVSGSVSKKGDSGQLHFSSTGNALDNYTVYWQTSAAPQGYYTSTACSVRGWMNQFTSEQGTITSNADGSYTVDVPNLDGKEFTATVVVTRQSAYSSVYDTFVLNGDGSVVMPTLVVLLLAVIVSLF